MAVEPERSIVRLDNLAGYLDEELTYPIDRSSVVEQIGAVEIEAPDGDDSETVATIIGSLGQERYESADELYRTVVGNLGEEHIGRKFYDDRGQHSVDTSGGPGEDRDVSF